MNIYLTYLHKSFKENKLTNTLLLIAICLIEITLIVSLLPVYFETSDDTSMNAIASGAISGSPSEYLIFTNIIIGKVLKLLFTTFPATNWYTWYVLSSAFAGYTSIQYSIQRISGKLWLKIFRHLLIFGLLIAGFLSLQFTRIAAITLLGGFLLIFSSKSKERWQMGLGIFLIVLGALIRFEVFEMYLILSIPFVVFYSIKKQYTKLVVISAAFAISFCAHFIDNDFYNNNPEFKLYREFNTLRSEINSIDNPRLSYQRKHDIIKKIGWTYNDFLLASHFNLDVGHPKFAKEKLMKLAAKRENFVEKTFSKDFIIQLQHSSLVLLNYLNAPYFYIFYFFTLLLLIEKRWNQFWAVLFYFLYILYISFFIYYYMDGALKGRILFGLVLPFFVFIIYQLNFQILFKSGFIDSKLSKTALLMLVAWFISIPIMELNEKREWINEVIDVNRKTTALIEKQKDDLYVNWVLRTEYNIFDLPFEQKNGYNLGWFAGSPFNKDKIERYTGNRELGAYSIYNKKIVWYYRNDFFYENHAPLVKEFYLSNYEDCSYNREIAQMDDNKLLIKETYFIPKP